MNSAPELKQIDRCEVCANSRLSPVLDLGLNPLCDDLVPIGQPRVCREYPIEILLCPRCYTAHQRFQVPKEELFPASYHYRARFTADVLTGMRDLVNACESRFGPLAGKKVLDIGCNDGSLLDFFAERGASTFGVEPTGACTDAERKGHRTWQEYFSTSLAKQIAAEEELDFITFTNVFAHIEDLSAVIEALRLLQSEKTVVVIENHYLGAVLEGNQFDTFYHEHARTYSCESFFHVAKSLDVEVLDVEFPARYGGNIRVFLGRHSEGRALATDLAAIKSSEGRFPEAFAHLAENVEIWRWSKSRSLNQMVSEFGKVPAKAFPARAAILVKLLGLNEDTISAVYEKPGSLKIGHYVPGTRIPIRSDDELFALTAPQPPLINLAWHIPGEIRNYLWSNGVTSDVVNILTSAELARPAAK